MLQPYGPADARLMIVSDCVSYRDLQSGTILNDREFDRMLTEAGVFRQHCFVSALIKDQINGQSFEAQVPPNKKSVTPNHRALHDRHVTPGVLAGLDALNRDIDLVRPKVILALGNGPLFALTGKWGIKSWRSSIIEYVTPSGHKCHIVPTYTPGYIQSVWKDRGTAIHDIRKAAALSRLDVDITPPNYNFIIEPDFATAAKTLQTLLGRVATAPTKLSVDIETRGGHIACTGIAWSAVDAICIPHLRAVVTEMPNWEAKIHYWREEEESFLLYLLFQILTHPNAEVIGQNFIYDAQYFYRHFFFVPRFKRDTMIAQHSMFNVMPKSLDFLSSLYCDYHVYWKDDSKNWSPKLGEKQLWIYNCVDCVRTFEIDTKQQLTLEAMLPSWPKLREIHDFQQSMFWPVLDTMNRGILPDSKATDRISLELQALIDERETWLEDVIGHPLNVGSPPQMADFFYRELAQRKVINRSSGNPTCDDAALDFIGRREPLLLPVCNVISEIRSIKVFKNTFIDMKKDVDGRLRSSFNIAGTKGYRFSSSENAFGSGGNLQNIPKGDEDSFAEVSILPNVRKNFIPDPDYIFFDIDLDSADLRIVVEEANIPAMREWLNEGKKPYVMVMQEYYKDKTLTKSHPAYTFFKAFCHGTHYMGEPPGMADKVNQHARSAGIPSFTIAELQKLQDWYFDLFPEIKTWHEKIQHEVSTKRYIENVFGYRFNFPDRIDKTVFNEAVALGPQSTVGNIINRGYKNLHDNHPDIQVLLQVHDSLAGQFHRDVTDGVEQIRKACEIVAPYPNPLIVPVGLKTSEISWGHCG